MRGISDKAFSAVAPGRIIPAGAGHLSESSDIVSSFWDHPRRCGAFKSGEYDYIQAEGSSPQVRGISLFLNIPSLLARIIPAGAGHLYSGSMVARGSGDHPRRCGAFAALNGQGTFFLGSSPQMRGIYFGS